MARQIYITQQDRERLLEAIMLLQESPDKRELPHIKQLEGEIDRAKVIADPRKVPGDVITMRSRVQLRDLSDDSEQEWTLVYPLEADAQQRRISVLAPLGTAMLGYRVGDAFEVELPRGKKTFRVESIPYQPEASGDYTL